MVDTPIDRSLVAESHPPHYLMHKYWARKPHNMVRAYIEHFTRPGDVVLDPFAGSGVTQIEAVLAGRRAIAVDVNPIASLITEATLKPIDSAAAWAVFKSIEERVTPRLSDYYSTTCPDCFQPAIISHVVWENVGACPECGASLGLGLCEKKGTKYKCAHCFALVSIPYRTVNQERMVEVWYVCRGCKPSKQRRKSPDSQDLAVVDAIAREPFESAIVDGHMFLSNRTLVYEGMSVASLFTTRNLRALSSIILAIREISDRNLRQLFEFVFSACVAQASRLIPFRNGLTTGGPAWTVSGFWVPSLHMELNAWNCFETRFRRTMRGKEHLASLLPPDHYRPACTFPDLADSKNVWTITQSSTDLSSLVPSDSVDYIFTDPPYGDSVPYLEYSTIWLAWLGRAADFTNEIIISDSSERYKDLADYAVLLRSALAECYRILKPGKWISLTFHNRRLDVWSAIVTAAIEAGFQFVNCVYQVPAVIPAKAQLSKAGSVVGDIVLNLRKPNQPGNQESVKPALSISDTILSAAVHAMAERGGVATTDEITRAVVIDLLQAGYSEVSEHKIVTTLATRFDREKSCWRLRAVDLPLVKTTPQLEDEIRATVRRAIDDGVRDERAVMAAVLSRLHNGRSPDLKDVARIYDEMVTAERESRNGVQLQLPFD